MPSEIEDLRGELDRARDRILRLVRLRKPQEAEIERLRAALAKTRDWRDYYRNLWLDAPPKTAPGCEWCAMGNEATMGDTSRRQGLQYMVCEASPSDRPDDPPSAASSTDAPPGAALGCTRP